MRKIVGGCFFLMTVLSSALPADNDRSATVSISSGGKQWNVLLVTVDTLRWDHVSAYGRSPVPTPAFDRLAQKSLLFRSAYSHNPVTLPAHANILTGLLPLWHGVSDNALFSLSADQLSMARFLKGKGYRTGAFIGAFPLSSRFGLNRGFDVYDESFESRTRSDVFFVERPAAEVLKPAREWLAGIKGKWFAWVHLFDPHHPYLPPSPYRQQYGRDLYSGEVAYVDAELGKFLAWLQESTLSERTVVIFTADHGEALGEKGELTHSYFAYNNTIHVPLFIAFPGVKAAGVEENVCHVDIFPTLCDILGLAPPPGLQGESLLPIARGQPRREKRIYFESLSPYFTSSWAPLRGFIRDRLKFIDLPVPEAYDLERDPGEEKNLARAETAAGQRQVLQELMQRYGRGSRPAPKTALDPETLLKLRSLGYISGGGGLPQKQTFTEKDDLKTMLPVYSLFQQALDGIRAGRTDEALQKLQQVIDASPLYTVAYSYLAGIWQDQGKTERAVSVLKRGLSRVRGNLLLQSKLGLVLAEGGDAEEAVQVLKECLGKDSTDPVLHNYMGLSLTRLGRWDEAEQHYVKALKLDPRYAPALNNLGNLYLARHLQQKSNASLRSAINFFQRAKKLAPKMANARNGLASAYLQAGQMDKAIAEWQEAEKLFPDDGQIAYNLGIAYLETGKPGEALARFSRCQKLWGVNIPEKQKKNLEQLIAEAKSKLGNQ